MNDPIGDSVRAILDGHVVLSRRLANQSHYPAIDVLHSISRLLPQLATPDEVKTARLAVKTLSTYQDAKDLIDVGAYRAGMNANIDHAVRLMPALEAFLKQEPNTLVPRSRAMSELQGIMGPGGGE